ncbi:hypothetical protein [Polaribacter sp. IC073]|uniref:hypothetical protein n=1 Tax=Polaribacter sp. IC073 TaxID=2508540 RepID=UPI001673E0F9|nr:hypothetical protein [Polaribacter sp. IC073]
MKKSSVRLILKIWKNQYCINLKFNLSVDDILEKVVELSVLAYKTATLDVKNEN